MPAQKDRWVSSLLFLLFCASSIPQCGSASLQQEPSPQHYFSGLEAGKTSLAFFTPSVSPGAQPFLEHIESSAEALQDYGVSVVKVNCPKEDVSRYCGKENALRKAFLFRGNRLIREFPTDALFDVNSIVANVLFALLFNEVKYVETLADLENIENVLKGKSNMVFAYVPATGTAEHRAVMEAAFVYGTIHQFVLTTEAALLKATSHDDPDVSSAWLLFCHCQRATEPAQPCRRTALAQPLTLLNIHRHLKLMGAPLVTEVAEDPEKISTVHLQLGLPLVFILSQKETYEADRRTAEFVAWQLLGKAGVALLSRDLVELNVLHRSNVALKTPDEGMPIQYLVLEDTDEVITLVEDKNKVKQIQEDEQEEEEEYEDEKEDNNQDIQDDQVVEAVSRDKKRELPLEQILVLTEENFHSSLSEAARTVVLFYASWEAVSLAVLRSYSEVAALLKAREAFEEAGNILSGHVRMGMYFEDDALALSQKYSVSPPALLLARRGGRSVEGIALPEHSVQDMVQMIRYELLDIFPEITVPNLPQYLQLGKPFLILFSAGDISQVESKEMLKLAKGRPQQTFVVCWLNLKKTPVGYGILRTHFSTIPPLPVLLWVNLHAGGQVFKFPSEQPITEMNILSWLEKLQAGLEVPSSTLSEEDWKPPLPAYNFLQMMEPSVPELSPHAGDTPAQHPPKNPGGDTAGGDTATREEPSQESRAEEVGSPGRGLRGTAPRLAARDKQGKRHSEL
ncbi:thioredoxin domain-containing protein 16 isoform X4 [Motacilla alba alba]|uniref:thioredoxin domain-containing protein 16 isoform X4 n=1 Tax=Motacilla alba alba TaxID=1094192 RepID=UPI0018D51406|nr:thioredoxin domain-containing protein 16 isoform X4 [Motacilla alba alba]